MFSKVGQFRLPLVVVFYKVKVLDINIVKTCVCLGRISSMIMNLLLSDTMKKLTSVDRENIQITRITQQLNFLKSKIILLKLNEE